MTEQYIRPAHTEITIDNNLKLRQVNEDESEKLFAVIDSNREYLAEFLPWAHETLSTEDSLSFVRQINKERQYGSQYGFGIYYDGNLCGHISLMHINDNQRPEIGYWISKNRSGEGITTRAARAVEVFGFRNLGVPEIIIKARVDNIASNSIAEKLGYELYESDQQGGESVNIWRKANEQL